LSASIPQFTRFVVMYGLRPVTKTTHLS